MQVEVSVVVTDGSTQQEGGDGQDETHQGDDHAHVANDVQGELHLSGKRCAVQTETNIPPSRKRNYPDCLLTWAERAWGPFLSLTLRVH